MARKYELISELYERTALAMMDSPVNWQSFLKTAGCNFRLRFDEQLLIYAQRPDATAVLEIERWNGTFGRWVNRGAKGIAVFADENRDRQRLTHYFDISDTHESSYSRPVPIWKIKSEYEKAVIETLENTFGETTDATFIASVIKESIDNAVEDNITDYLGEMRYFSEGSNLEYLPEDEVRSSYKELVKNSVSYMIMARLGIDADLYYSKEDFAGIRDFNSCDALNALGYATSDIAEMGLTPISKTISALDKQNRIIADVSKNKYNKAIENSERSSDYGRNNIHDGGRLQPTESELTGTTGSNSWQMVTDEEKLPKGTLQDSVLQSTDKRNPNAAFSGGTTKSDDVGRVANERDGHKGGIERRTKSYGYDDVGTDNEQPAAHSTGNREITDNLRIEDIKPIPPYNEQLAFFNEKAEEKSSAFSISQEVIDATISSGSGFVNGKMRIYEQFTQSFSQKENADFLKNEYGIGGSSNAGGFTEYNQDHDAKGLLIRRGYADNAPKVLLKWTQVAKRVEELIREDRYLNLKQKEQYPSWLQEQIIKRAEATKRKRNREIQANIPTVKDNTYNDENVIGREITIDNHLFVIERVDKISQDVSMRDVTFQNTNGYPINRVEKFSYVVSLLKEQYPQSEKVEEIVSDSKYEYHLGDKVYIGATEYEILYFDDKRVMLYDFDMPLFNKEFTRTDFDIKVHENPLNDHLKVTVAENITEEKDLASRLVDFIKDYDPYGYQDGMEIGETDEDKIEQVRRGLLSTKGIQQTLEFLHEVNLEDNPDYVEEVTTFIAELHALQVDEPLLEKAKALIDDYCREEFESETGADYTDLSSIGIAYTTTEDNEHEIQSKVDLVNFKVETYVDNLLVRTLAYDTLSELIDNELESLSFSELTYVSDEEVAKEKIVIEPPKWEKKSKVKSFDLHPNIPMVERKNFDLKNNPIEVVGKKERFNRNLEAIKMLKQLESEGRFATTKEQQILSKYVGWGGIPEAFDDRNSSWTDEYLQLKNNLSDEEYASARESTLTAFYTPPEVTKAIYKAMAQMGFKEGNLLEPSCGIGNFIGMLPSSMENAKIYGVELDKISAGIAQQLYQKSSIAAQGFEEVNIPDSFFDGVVGNIPFGDFKVLDKRYDKHHFLIHDYFFAKSLDKLRPGGVMALVTSKGTMDKENSAVRKYIAQRAELVGAVRLPNNTFKGNAGTEVVSDIIFLQKRDRLVDIEPEWIHLDTDENGIKMNSYFVEHPEMILGEMKMVNGRYGMEATCQQYENAEIEAQLNEAIANIHAEMTEYEVVDDLEENNSIPADPSVRNFSYTLLEDKIYFRENSKMSPVEVSATAQNRIKGMIVIRDTVRNLIELQIEDYSDAEIKKAQLTLNTVYDLFTKKYGLINSRANTSVFSDDSAYSLLSALEIINENGELERKADMFTKRTIKPHTPVTEVDTASEALAVSMGEKARIDMEYMSNLTGRSEKEIYEDLKGVIFLNPKYEEDSHIHNKYLMAEEYLSGNVREKLREAKVKAELYPKDYKINVEALEQVQPIKLTASEISVRLGATWLPPDIVEQFMFEFLETPRYAQWNVKIHFSNFTSEWNIEGKSYDRSNVKAQSTYGTSRINAYKIIEDTLNLKDVRIFDYVEDDEGRKKAVLNKKETAIAQAKQELIKQGFQDWIWQDPIRREELTTLYNEKFNSIRPREYDGSHITFNGINPEINLRDHQRNAVAHILYGGNTLLAHAVGAGKTFEMVAASQESKRLGLCNKSLFVVPNHLTEQWAAEYLQLYPAANILVATKKDFETKNRKKFCGRIATGDYDAVIIGHSQFESTTCC